jgi:integrase
MPAINKKREIPFFPLYEKFIADSKSGKRLQPNGKRVGAITIVNYENPLKLLKKFCASNSFVLRFRPVHYLNSREIQTEKRYWKKFHLKFTNYLYKTCGHYDNYVGSTLKIIRTFFNYINKELMLGIGDFHKLFYVRREEIPVLTLLPEELNFLIYDTAFHESLSATLKEVKNIFVFGCTVALRYSDLIALTKANLRIINNTYYLLVRSKKTATDTQIKLPDYAIAILEQFKNKGNRLMPHHHITGFNIYVKNICEKAAFTQPVNKVRSIRGELVQVKNAKQKGKSNEQCRFCDLASSHLMRRTAITTMLCLGVPEQLVRKISGHAPMSKEFFRYISLAQTYQDKEVSKMFEILKERRLVNYEVI